MTDGRKKDKYSNSPPEVGMSLKIKIMMHTLSTPVLGAAPIWDEIFDDGKTSIDFNGPGFHPGILIWPIKEIGAPPLAKKCTKGIKNEARCTGNQAGSPASFHVYVEFNPKLFEVNEKAPRTYLQSATRAKTRIPATHAVHGGEFYQGLIALYWIKTNFHCNTESHLPEVKTISYAKCRFISTASAGLRLFKKISSKSSAFIHLHSLSLKWLSL